MTQSSPMPAAFIGHGSPMNTLEVNRYTSAWRELGRALPRPRAVLAISAHWFIHSSAVTAMQQPRVIHDFYGFPKSLFEFDYPAPGSPDLAREVTEVAGSYVGLDEDSWGLDHGTWSVLAHVFPAADVPVVQLSIHAGAPAQYHHDLGARLAPLRERGVFILCSGNVVHNLRRVDWGRPEGGYDWAERFDAEVQRRMADDPATLASIDGHADYAAAVPTPEHFWPLLYLAGLCSQAQASARPFVQGAAMGSITMTSYVLGLPPPGAATDDGNGVSLPDGDVVPPHETNL